MRTSEYAGGVTGTFQEGRKKTLPTKISVGKIAAGVLRGFVRARGGGVEC